MYGVVGTFTNDATATASDIISGKTAYVRGSRITGTAQKNEKVLVSGYIDIGGSRSDFYMYSHDSSFFNTGTNLSYASFKRSARVRVITYSPHSSSSANFNINGTPIYYNQNTIINVSNGSKMNIFNFSVSIIVILEIT